jgi:hypothetical protein
MDLQDQEGLAIDSRGGTIGVSSLLDNSDMIHYDLLDSEDEKHDIYMAQLRWCGTKASLFRR